MSTELLQTIKQQVVTLTLPEKEQLASFLAEQLHSDAQNGQSVAVASAAESDAALRQRRSAWLQAHQAEYGGQYVALVGDQLISTGRTFPAAVEAARAAGYPQAFVTYLSKPDEVGECGGWA